MRSWLLNITLFSRVTRHRYPSELWTHTQVLNAKVKETAFSADNHILNTPTYLPHQPHQPPAPQFVKCVTFWRGSGQSLTPANPPDKIDDNILALACGSMFICCAAHSPQRSCEWQSAPSMLTCVRLNRRTLITLKGERSTFHSGKLFKGATKFNTFLSLLRHSKSLIIWLFNLWIISLFIFRTATFCARLSSTSVAMMRIMFAWKHPWSLSLRHPEDWGFRSRPRGTHAQSGRASDCFWELSVGREMLCPDQGAGRRSRLACSAAVLQMHAHKD